MSDFPDSSDDSSDDEDRTDPHVALPKEPTREVDVPEELDTIPPVAARGTMSSARMLPPRPSSDRPGLGGGLRSSRPPGAPPTGFANGTTGAAARAFGAGPGLREPSRLASRPPPGGAGSVRPGSIPPARMPKPSDAPPARTELGAPQRHRLAQMETQLDQARAALARQRAELDELRLRLDDKEARLDRLSEDARSASTDVLEARLREMDAEREALAEALRRHANRADDTTAADERLEQVDLRLRALEEGTEGARIRMRLERVGHRLEELDERLLALEAVRESNVSRDARHARIEERMDRIDSLFSELADELQDQRDASVLDALSARLDGMEALVLSSGSAERGLRAALERQAERLDRLEATGTASGRAAASDPRPSDPRRGDDLTRIKGIGPKFARLLGELGVTTFAAIAAWTSDDVELYAAELGVKPSRIEKAGWIASATSLVG